MRRIFLLLPFQGDWLLKARDKRENRRVAPPRDVGLTLRAKRAEEGKGKEAEKALEEMRLALKKVSRLAFFGFDEPSMGAQS